MDQGRVQQILTLWRAGKPYAEIGAVMGISRQRAHQIVRANATISEMNARDAARVEQNNEDAALRHQQKQIEHEDAVSRRAARKAAYHKSTSDLWQSGRTIEQVAEITGLAANTVVLHVNAVLTKEQKRAAVHARKNSMNLGIAALRACTV